MPLDDDTIVVPVPDTSKAAADAMAFTLGVPRVEGLIRNRYAGRTFIEGSAGREAKAATKYTPLREVLEGKRVLLVEDSIVRSTTMRVLVSKIRELGRAQEIHVRVACPPIIAPCFYGIDMSTDPRAVRAAVSGKTACRPKRCTPRWPRDLGADSLRYLPVESIARAIGNDREPAVPGVHHRRVPDAVRAEAVSDRAGQLRARSGRHGAHVRGGDDLKFVRV